MNASHAVKTHATFRSGRSQCIVSSRIRPVSERYPGSLQKAAAGARVDVLEAGLSTSRIRKVSAPVTSSFSRKRSRRHPIR